MFFEEFYLILYISLYIGIPRVSSTGSVWPSGCYGLPQPKSGCLSSSEWGSGWWYEDRRLSNQSTARVPQYSHLKGTFTQAITKRYFCIKKKDNGMNKPWLDGQYCIYQGLLKPCPPGLVKGSIGWKNKDTPNHNHHSGMVPSGVFASSTTINYCCKINGSKENSISLPVNRPFVLLAYGSRDCQSVKWARTTQEYLRFSVEEKMTLRGFHPFVDDIYALRYCYYQLSNQTLTDTQRTFSRYLNQTSVHQERYAAWHIKPQYSYAQQFQLLVLRFTRFIFHASNISSYLEVFDGPNESAASLGRFSSTHSPLGGSITSSTNQLLLVLHFGDRSGTYDLEFNYHISSAVSTPSHQPTSLTTEHTSSSPHTSSSKVTPSTLPNTSSFSHTSTQPPISASTKITSLPYTSSSKMTSLPSTSHYNNVTFPTNSTDTHLYSHGNDIKTRLLLYTLLPAGGIVVLIGIAVIIVRRRRKRIAYSRLTSLSVNEIVNELNENMDGCFEGLEPSTSCAVLQVTSDEHQADVGMTTRTEHTSSDSDDEMIPLDRNPTDFPSTGLQNVSTSSRNSPSCRYESDPVLDHSPHVPNEELRQLHGMDEEERSEAERIAMLRLQEENQNEQYHLPKPKENVKNDQASNC